MTLWRRTRTEAAGAWRSVRHELGRRGPDGRRPSGPGGTGPDEVTSDGLSTFGGAPTPYGDSSRRLLAVSAFGALAVVGAAGSYFAVVNGVGALLGQTPAGAEPYPLAAEASGTGGGEQANSGLGRGTAAEQGRQPAARATATPAASTVRVLPASAPSPATTTGPGRTAGPGSPSAECCPNPPVPTPTAPDDPSATSDDDDFPDDGWMPGDGGSPDDGPPEDDGSPQDDGPGWSGRDGRGDDRGWDRWRRGWDGGNGRHHSRRP